MKELGYCYRCGSSLESREHEGRERQYCPECGEIRYRNAIPVVGVFVIREEEILLIKRGREPRKGTWSFPAGYLEHDEKPEEGAVRELEEETGLKARTEELELVTTIHLENPDKYVLGNAYCIDFNELSGELNSGSDAEKARFWTIDEMSSRVEDIESPKIVDAAKKALEMTQSQD